MTRRHQREDAAVDAETGRHILTDCPMCGGRGEVPIGRDPDTNAVYGDLCSFCQGDGRVPLALVDGLDADDDDYTPTGTTDYGPPPF